MCPYKSASIRRPATIAQSRVWEAETTEPKQEPFITLIAAEGPLAIWPNESTAFMRILLR